MDMLQMDVFNTFIELLRQTGNVTKGQIDADEMRQVKLMFFKFFLSIFIFISFDVGNLIQ